ANDAVTDTAAVVASVGPASRLWQGAAHSVVRAVCTRLRGARVGWAVKPAAQQQVARFSFALGEGQQFSALTRQVVAISPDGARIAYVANNRLYLRPTAKLDATVLAGTDRGAVIASPVFSPDGLSVAFASSGDRTLKKIAIAGGTALTICSIDAPFGISWTGDDILVGQGARGILRVSANGGTPQAIISVKPGEE